MTLNLWALGTRRIRSLMLGVLMQHPLKRMISQKQGSRVGLVHSNQSKMPGDKSVGCTPSPLHCLLKYKNWKRIWRPSSFFHEPCLLMTSLYPSPSLIMSHCLCRLDEGVLAWSSLLAVLREFCRWFAWDLVDAHSGPSGQKRQFKVCYLFSSHQVFNQWVKKKSRDARHAFCTLLHLGCAFCLLVMSGAGTQSGVNDNSEKAWGSHLASGSCSGSLLVQDPQLFLKLASADICSENACQNYFHQFWNYFHENIICVWVLSFSDSAECLLFGMQWIKKVCWFHPYKKSNLCMNM